MQDKQIAEKVVASMYDNDAFSQWLGIERLLVQQGHCIIRMIVRKEMLNGFGIAHGGITYSLADSAFAFACNSHGRKSVSVETSISHTQSLKEGDLIIAEARELHVSNKIGVYQIDVTNQDGKTVAIFKGTCYRTSNNWEV